MKLIKWFFTCMGAPLFLAGCASVNVGSEQPVVIKASRFEISESVTTERHANAVEMLYFNPDNALTLRRPDGTEQILSDNKGGDVRLAYATLHSDGKALFAIWRPKLVKPIEGVGVNGDKLIYVRTSLDDGKTFGPVHRLNQKGGAFAPLVASNGLGDMYVAYTDERNGGLDLYLNFSNDRGESWKAEDIKLNDDAQRTSAIDPSLVSNGNWVHASWLSRGSDQQFKLEVRSSEDRGAHWLTAQVAHSSVSQPGSPAMVRMGTTGLLLCWADVDAVRCKRSNDQNKTWGDSVTIADSAGTEGLFLSTDPKGQAHLLIVKKPSGDEKARINLFHTFTSDGATFSSLHRLNGGEPFGASTILPKLRFGDDGSAMAVWVDMRYVKPVIAGNYSSNGGASWLAQPIVLAGKVDLYHYFPSISYVSAGQYQIAWQESPDRTLPSSVIGTRTYRQGDPGVTMPTPNIERLKERVDAFWSAREAVKYDLVYNYMDPFFRETNSQSNYVKTQGLVKYYGHRIVGEPKLTEQKATVQVAYISEVPEIVMRGKKIVVPKKEVEVPQEWIWVDGDWYLVFLDIMGKNQLLD